MTGKDILKITEPFELFSIDKSKIKKEFRSLSLKYHPDKNKDSNVQDIFSKINELHSAAEKMLSQPQWVSITRAMFVNKDTLQSYLIKFKIKRDFELGQVFIGDSIVMYTINSMYSKFYNNAKYALKFYIKYKNNKMEQEMSRFIPVIKKTFSDINGNFNIIFDKAPDMLPLRDVLNYYGETFDPKAIAWILSSLYNLACYFNYLKISHCGISLDSCFISPEFHSGILFGGWWYTVPRDGKLIGMEIENFKLLKKDLKKAEANIDLNQIKAIGRELFFDRSGAKLVRRRTKELKPLFDWLLHPASDHAISDYKYYYSTVLPETFGPPKFIKMGLDLITLYKGV